ncbi:hypothetical protein CLOHAE12215_01196 [Clostridium haemolyticum]|uniref:hypothetical protein n=1 Tax=Clostridium haemolyticum TaxID=84025 RepID=UPI001C3A1467|nr:hypothetical protein [Clostridium haemolyticum]CAG7839781.1 hypothetical protein CLOHAE12215_01196 [Clostridium haemolyticum]
MIFKSCYSYALENIQEVDDYKEWTIKFNKPIDKYSIYNNIFVEDSKGNMLTNPRYSILDNGQVVKLKYFNNKYITGEIYTLKITNLSYL